MNDNQNHRVREGWTSSRVIAPPGGGGSLMLGMAPPGKRMSHRHCHDGHTQEVILCSL